MSSQAAPNQLASLVDVCRFLPNFLDKGTWNAQTPTEVIVLQTLARSRGTYETIIDLVSSDRTLQAAMLGRSLFEDMAVMHWIVLHEDDPDWLLRRFKDHADAMRLVDAETRSRLGREAVDDVSDLVGREDELRKAFGRYAERDWWGKHRNGRDLTMPRSSTCSVKLSGSAHGSRARRRSCTSTTPCSTKHGRSAR
jgi:hypothetical protein